MHKTPHTKFTAFNHKVDVLNRPNTAKTQVMEVAILNDFYFLVIISISYGMRFLCSIHSILYSHVVNEMIRVKVYASFSLKKGMILLHRRL